MLGQTLSDFARSDDQHPPLLDAFAPVEFEQYPVTDPGQDHTAEGKQDKGTEKGPRDFPKGEI